MGMIKHLMMTKARLVKQKSELVGYVIHQLNNYKSETVQRYTNNISLFEEYFNKKRVDKHDEEFIFSARTPIDNEINLHVSYQHVGDWMLVSQLMINEFAAITRDEQWVHVDVERATRELPYKSTVAHGFLILSLIPALTANRQLRNENNEIPKSIVNCGLTEVQFMAPLKSNTRVRAKTNTRSIESQKNGLKIVDEITIETSAFKTVCKAVIIYRLIF